MTADRSNLSRLRSAWLPAFLLTLLLTGCAGVPKTTFTTMPDGDRIVHPNDTLFSTLLTRAIGANGAVSYDLLRSDSSLTEYLEEIALARPEIFPSRQQQLAFWINAHNAYVLDMLRSNGRVKSIDEISGFKSAKTAWIAGQRYSLDDIEHHIIVRDFREPRAFFALYDGAKSSPGLRSAAYEESTLSDQLDAQLKGFLADSTHNYLDKKQNTIYLSQIFRQYSDELEKPAGSLLAFVRAFAPPEMGSWIDQHPLVNLQFLRYDNGLNSSDAEPVRESAPRDQPRKPQPRKPSGGIR